MADDTQPIDFLHPAVAVLDHPVTADQLRRHRAGVGDRDGVSVGDGVGNRDGFDDGLEDGLVDGLPVGLLKLMIMMMHLVITIIILNNIVVKSLLS